VKRLKDILAANLRSSRSDKGWTQEDLAGKSGVSARYIGAIERRAVSPSVDILEKLAKALGLPAARLLS
jgi:transcriptional regulator with XRE-family HTH domain